MGEFLSNRRVEPAGDCWLYSAIKHVPLRLSCILLGALIALLLRLFASGQASGPRECACTETRMDTGCHHLMD